jgi:hypothetical protein
MTQTASEETDFGYVRVSANAGKGRKAQHVENQIERLAAHRIAPENSYTDDVSARKARRPEWDKLWAGSASVAATQGQHNSRCRGRSTRE